MNDQTLETIHNVVVENYQKNSKLTVLYFCTVGVIGNVVSGLLQTTWWCGVYYAGQFCGAAVYSLFHSGAL